MNNTQKDEYTVIKAITTILVVIGHATRMYSRGGGAIEMPMNNLLDCITIFIYAFHMPLFVFVSGAVYSSCISIGKYKDMKKFIVTKAKRLLVPYFAFGLLYVTPTMLLLRITELNIKGYIFEGIICNIDSRHLWYLYVLFIMLILTRIMQPVVDKYPIVMWVLFVVCTIVAFRYWIAPNIFGIRHLARYYCYFIGGYLFDKKKEWLGKILSKYWWCSIFELLFILYVVLFTVDEKWRVLAAYLGIFMCYALVTKTKDFICKIKVYEIIQKNSMGIYLFHPMIIYLAFFIENNRNISPYIFSMVVIIIASVLSYVATIIIKRAKLNFLLGE